jgi:hypothetical protein
MERKLIITPFEQGAFWVFHKIINEGSLSEENNPIDIPHILLAAITMAGVDSIYSIGHLQNTNTKLVKKIVNESSINKWVICNKQIDETLKMYSSTNRQKENSQGFRSINYFISHLYFAMKTNSVVLYLGNLNELKDQNILPPEFDVPFKILLSSIQTKSANLPVVKYDIDKKDIKKLIEVISSKEFNLYKEAQSEIEASNNLTERTINLIEKAGKDLYRKNSHILNLNESIVKAIPLSSKVINLFFGKIPGELTELFSKVLIDYLNLNKTIPLYNYDSFVTGLMRYRMDRLNIITKKKLNSLIKRGNS